jgi:hypothetical protein
MSHQSIRDLQMWSKLASTETDERPIRPLSTNGIMHTGAADVRFGGTLDDADNPKDPSGRTKGYGKWKDRAECISIREINSILMVLMRTLGEREEGGNIIIEALRRQIECRARDKRIRGVQQAHDEETLSLGEGARRAWAPVFGRVDTIRCKKIRRRTVTSFLTWRPSSETDAAVFRCGWDDGAP